MKTRKEIDRQEQTTVITSVEFNIDGEIVQCDIPHFMPKDEDEIRIGIENRMASEARRIEQEKEILES